MRQIHMQHTSFLFFFTLMILTSSWSCSGRNAELCRNFFLSMILMATFSPVFRLIPRWTTAKFPLYFCFFILKLSFWRRSWTAFVLITFQVLCQCRNPPISISLKLPLLNLGICTRWNLCFCFDELITFQPNIFQKRNFSFGRNQMKLTCCDFWIRLCSGSILDH